MNANYAEICMVGNLETDFEQVPLVHIFWNFHNIVVKHQQLKSAEQSKNIFLGKNSTQKITLRKILHRSNQFLAVNLILG